MDLLETNYVKVAIKSEIPVGKMKHIEINEKEIMIANVEGNFYAVSDRCGHENARLSTGTLTNTTVICPFHYSRFDVTTGKLISGPILEGSDAANILAKVPVEARKRPGAARCGFATDQCRTTYPPLEMHRPEHWIACWHAEAMLGADA